MEAIDQAHFNFSPTVGLAVSVMVGFLVFAVALDLRWDQFHRVLRRPKAPLIGLVAQYVILPSVAFGVARLIVDTPSIAVTPFLFAFMAAMNPDTKAFLQKIDIDPKRVIVMLLIMLVVPITIGMLIRAKRPETADKIRLWSRRLAGGVFAVVVAILILGNVKVLGTFAKTALPPVLLTFAIAVALGWGLARVSGLVAADRRAVTLEVAFQNVALATGMAVVFFPALAGVAITSVLWGVVHLTLGFALAAMWMRVPITESSAQTS